MYPQGKLTWFSKHVGGVLKYFKRDGASEFFALDGANSRVLIADTVKQVRGRFTIAQVNAGVELLPALPGYAYRMVSGGLIGEGGAVTSVTTVDILGTQTTAVKLVAGAQAALTENTLVRDAAILAAGASFAVNDVNTAITVDVTGSDITVATHVQVFFTYVVEVV